MYIKIEIRKFSLIKLKNNYGGINKLLWCDNMKMTHHNNFIVIINS